MSIRVWAGPWIGSGTLADPYRPKVAQFCDGGQASFFPSNSDGTPASTWVITIGRAASWAAAEADAQLVDLFAGDLPSAIDTVEELKNLLRTRTVGDVPLARRQAIQANLDTLGVVRADFTLSTPLWKVFQRVASTLFEKSFNFAAGFNF